MKVQLLSFPGCPHAAPTRERLQRALAALGGEVTYEEIDTSAASCDPALAAWASPTVLVEGVDLEGRSASGGGCRLYDSRKGLTGAPSEELIRAALVRTT